MSPLNISLEPVWKALEASLTVYAPTTSDLTDHLFLKFLFTLKNQKAAPQTSTRIAATPPICSSLLRSFTQMGMLLPPQ